MVCLFKIYFRGGFFKACKQKNSKFFKITLPFKIFLYIYFRFSYMEFHNDHLIVGVALQGKQEYVAMNKNSENKTLKTPNGCYFHFSHHMYFSFYFSYLCMATIPPTANHDLMLVYLPQATC